jgi:hypothetical protein
MKIILQKYISLLLILFVSTRTYAQVPVMNSFEDAAPTIYLDFDGETVNSTAWNGGATLVCAPSGLTETQITEIFNRVAEDYRPFNINVTTDPEIFETAPILQRIRVIITPTSNFTSGVGGTAYVGSFTWGDDTPAFVFSDKLGYSPKMVGEACSHESGHTLGLPHQSAYDANCNFTNEYNPGTGGGQIGWAPIMGNSYYKNLSRWHNGPTNYSRCAGTFDELAEITSAANGITYRSDDNTDDFGTAKRIGVTTFGYDPQRIVFPCIIETNTDKDMFKFYTSQAGARHVVVTPGNVSADWIGANLDVKMTLYDASANLIAVYDPADVVGIDIMTPVLSAGLYYVEIEGTGNANCSNYGSLGSYIINIDLPTSVPVNNSFSRQSISEKKEDISLRPKVAANLINSGTVIINSPGMYNYEIYGSNGVLISKGNLTTGINSILVSGNKSGLYLIRYTGGGKQWTDKFVRQ